VPAAAEALPAPVAEIVLPPVEGSTAMLRDVVKEDLAMAQRHVEDGERIVEGQRARVAILDLYGRGETPVGRPACWSTSKTRRQRTSRTATGYCRCWT